MLFTDTSKFKIRKGYGAFTIPKNIIEELGWESGDLIGFWGLHGKLIQIQRILKKEGYQRLKEEGNLKYNKEFCKKITVVGGSISLGVKTFPKPLLKEFKLKDGKIIYFLPMRYTWLKEIVGNNTDNTVFMAFNEKNLEGYEQEPKEDLEKDYKKWLIKEYELPFFNKRFEISYKNNEKSKKSIKDKNREIHIDRIKGIRKQIKKLEEWISTVESRAHPQKKKIIKDLKRSFKEFKLKAKELQKQTKPEEVFKEWSKEEIEQSRVKIKKEKMEKAEKMEKGGITRRI
jgi:hypothetical protein